MFKRIEAAYFFISIFLVLLLCHSWHGPDIWYHLYWGRDLIQNGNWIPAPPVVLAQPIPANGYWIFQSLVYFAYSVGGIYLVSALFASLWIGIAALWLNITRLFEKPFGPVVFAAFVICMQLRFEHRPEVFSYFFITLFIFLGERFFKNGKIHWHGVAVLALLQAIWTNCHGYFVFGPLLAALMAWRGTGNWRVPIAILPLMLLCTLISPFGYHNWESVWLYAQLGRATAEFNSELMPPPIGVLFLPNTTFWVAWTATAALVLKSLWQRKEVLAALLSIVGLILSAQAIRNMPLVFLFSPIVWRQLTLPKRLVYFQRPAGALMVLIALFGTGSVVSGHYHRWVSSLSTFGIKMEWASYPLGAAEFLKSIDFKGTVFCDSYDGGYLEYNLENIKVAGDSYFSDGEITKKFFASIRSPQYLELLDKSARFDAFVINIENLEVMDMLMSRSDLVPAYADSHRAVFVSRPLVPQATGNLSAFTYYHGEDLRHWAYAFGTVSWMGFAAQRQDAFLIRKILTDVGQADHVPEALMRIALKFAIERRDEEVVRMLAAIKGRLDGQ